MFERPDLTEAYTECVDGAKVIARLCATVRLPAFNLRAKENADLAEFLTVCTGFCVRLCPMRYRGAIRLN